jgi:hypothetical protein
MLERDDLSMARSQPKLYQGGLGMRGGEGWEQEGVRGTRGSVGRMLRE